MTLTKTIPLDEAIDFRELITLVNQRSKTYGLLARLYQSEINQFLLDKLHTMRFPLKTGNDNIDKGYQLIATYLSNLWENSLDELAADYSRIFIGQGVDAFSAAYPFESVYTSEKRLLMQDARDEVLAIYRSEGLEKKDTWKEGEDHLAVELEFAEILCNRSVDALHKQNEDEAFTLFSTQLHFLDDHLVSWVPMMNEDVKKFAKTTFYRGLAFLTDGFLETDKQFLQNVLYENK